MRRIIVSLSLIAACTSAQAQEPSVLSVQAAMDYAVKNNAAAKNARIDIDIQDAQNKQVTAVALPNINGKGEFMDFLNPQKSFIPGDFVGQPGIFIPVQFTPKYSTTANVSASQLLFDGSVMTALQARKAVMELRRQQGQLTDETIRYNVQRSYYTTAITYRQWDILKNSLALARSVANDVYILKQNGYAEKIEVDRATVAVNNLVSDSIRISNAIVINEQLLKYQMGMAINQPIVLSDTSLEQNLIGAANISEQAIDYTRRTETQILSSALKLNEFNLKRYKMAVLPTLALFGNMGYNFATNNFEDVFKWRKYYQFSSLIGLQLNVPIFNGFKRTNQVKEARLNIEKSKNDLDNIKLTIDLQVTAAKTSLKNALILMDSRKENLVLANSVVDLARKKYKAGVGSNTEVSLAQADLLAAQNNYFASLLDVVYAQTDLKKALGNFK